MGKRCARAAAVAFAAGAMTVSIAGCGGDSESPQGLETTHSEVRKTVEDFYASMKEGDAATVCAMLSPEARQETIDKLSPLRPSASCERTFGRFLKTARRSGALPPDAVLRLEEIAVDGDSAVVTLAIGENPVTDLPLTRRGGRWTISSPAF